MRIGKSHWLYRLLGGSKITCPFLGLHCQIVGNKKKGLSYFLYSNLESRSFLRALTVLKGALVLSTLMIPHFAQPQPSKDWQRHITIEMDRTIKKHKIKKKHLGIHVLTSRNEVVYALNEKRSFTPASVTKMITAAAALDAYPPGSTFKTQLMTSASIAGDQLKGALTLKGGGDPAFTSEKMWVLVNHFVRTGIRTIQGPIYVDDSRFDAVRFDGGRQDQRVHRAYDAPVGAMSFNWNSVNIYVRPGEKRKAAATIFLDPVNDYVVAKNSVRTGNSTRLAVARHRKETKNVFTVNGTVARGVDEAVKYASITDPDLWAGANLLSFLKQRGVTVKDSQVINKPCSECRLLAEVESEPIERIVALMQKFSNNFIAEMLVKNLGAKESSEPATMAAGLNAIHGFLSRLGIQRQNYHIESPSGFSRKNRIRPLDMATILQNARNNFELAPEFMAALPVAGVDGTLKNRMKSAVAQRKIRAKTGMLNGVYGLAGYAGADDFRRLTFVFFYNGPASFAKVRQFFDELAENLVE